MVSLFVIAEVGALRTLLASCDEVFGSSAVLPGPVLTTGDNFEPTSEVAQLDVCHISRLIRDR